MEPTRRDELKQVTWLLLVTMAARMLLTRLINGPNIFTDEYQYVEMARMLPRTLGAGVGLYWDEHAAYFPCWLYPLLISPFINLLSWDNAYHAIQFMNGGLMALAVLPVYLLAREVTDHRRALLAAGLTALLPGAGYSPMIMTENLFFPVFALAMWAIYRAVLTPTPWRRLGAGMAAGLAFHVKPHGILLPAVAALTVLIFEVDRRRDEDASPGRKFMRFLGGVGRHWLTALGWFVVMIPRLLVVKYMERPDLPFAFGSRAEAMNTLMSVLGTYTDLARGKNEVEMGAGAYSLLRYGLAWAWCLGLLPAWMVLRQAVDALRRREGPAMRLLVILTLVATAGMLAMVSRHTSANNAIWRLHERYFFVVLPLALIVFSARAGTLVCPPAIRWLWDVVLVAVVFLNAWIAQNVSWSLPASSPTFTSALMLMHPDLVGLAVVLGFLVPALIAVGLLLFRESCDFRWQCTVVALLLLAFNVGWYGYHTTYLNDERKESLNLAKKVARAMDPQDGLIILADGMNQGSVWQVGIRNPGRGPLPANKNTTNTWAWQSPASGTIDVSLRRNVIDWYQSRLRFLADGSLTTPLPGKGAGKTTWLLASNTWRANQAPEKGFEDCALYRMDGKKPFLLDIDQIREFRELGETTDTLSDGRAHTRDLKLTVIERKLPESFTVGEEDRVVMKVRNDGKYALPGGSIRMAMGYHWSDPKRLGNWTAVVWDDDHHVKLAEWLEPGGVCEVSLEVLAPDKPGESYLLGVKPLLLVYHGKQKDKIWVDAKDVGFTAWVKVAAGKEIEAGKDNRTKKPADGAAAQVARSAATATSATAETKNVVAPTTATAEAKSAPEQTTATPIAKNADAPTTATARAKNSDAPTTTTPTAKDTEVPTHVTPTAKDPEGVAPPA